MGEFPNKDTQFKPGNPGGPGRAKGYRPLSHWIQELLNDEEFTTMLPDPRDGYKEFKGAPLKVIVQVAALKAIQGDDKAREWLAKYGYGQKFDIEASGNITINLVSYDDSGTDTI